MGIVKIHTYQKRRIEAPPASPAFLLHNAGIVVSVVLFRPGGDILKKRIRRLLLSERGDSSYISSFVYILVVAIMIAFIINVFHIISVKQEMDHISNQLVKQIQLNGGKSSDTDALFNYLASELSEVSGLTYQVTSSGSTDRIQIGTPFYVSVTGRCYLGGFWKFNLVPINIRAQGAGVSEHYWK